MERPQPYKISQRLIEESQLKEVVEELVRQTLAEMLGINTIDTQPQRQWYDTEKAYILLDLDSAEQLRSKVRDSTLRLGIEVRDMRRPGSQIPRYQFHLTKCEARLSLPPEKRKGKKTA